MPIPTPARQSLEAYLGTRPPVPSPKLFWGQRGPLTTRGIRSLCAKYGTLLGVHLHPHAFRHTMANKFLQDTSNDLVSLAQILGHESLQTTRRYAQRSEQQLGVPASLHAACVATGFVKIRHYGLLAHAQREARLLVCRRLLLVATVASVVSSADTVPIEPAQPRYCPQCGGTRLIYRELVAGEPGPTAAARPADSS